MIVYFTGQSLTIMIHYLYKLSDLHALESWSQNWLMNFNTSKCHSMKFSQSRNSIDTIIYYFNSTPLSVVDHSKYLSVILQSDFNWNKHVKRKVSKASSMLALIQRNLKISSIKTKELAYKALVIDRFIKHMRR